MLPHPFLLSVDISKVAALEASGVKTVRSLADIGVALKEKATFFSFSVKKFYTFKVLILAYLLSA